jgi:hypothetical protein
MYLTSSPPLPLVYPYITVSSLIIHLFLSIPFTSHNPHSFILFLFPTTFPFISLTLILSLVHVSCNHCHYFQLSVSEAPCLKRNRHDMMLLFLELVEERHVLYTDVYRKETRVRFQVKRRLKKKKKEKNHDMGFFEIS